MAEMGVMAFMADWTDSAEGADLADGTMYKHTILFWLQGSSADRNIVQDGLWELTPLTLLT